MLVALRFGSVACSRHRASDGAAANEIDPGMMLPHGSIENGFGPLADLLAAGHDVVSEVFPNCKVAVHVSSLDIAPWYFEMLAQAGYTPDVVAVSQYSKWHLQSIEDISNAIAS